MTKLANRPNWDDAEMFPAFQSDPPKRPWWRQVSISNLLLLMVIAGLWVSWRQRAQEAAATGGPLCGGVADF